MVNTDNGIFVNIFFSLIAMFRLFCVIDLLPVYFGFRFCGFMGTPMRDVYLN